MVYVYESVFIFTCLPNYTEQYELYVVYFRSGTILSKKKT